MINKSNSKDSLNRKSNLINKNNTNTNNNSSNKQLINNNNKNNASFNDDIKYKKNRANSFVVDNGEDELYEEINNNQNNNNYVDEELIEAATVNKSTTSQQSNIVSAYNRLGPKALYCIGIFESILAILEMFFVMFLLNSLQAILSKRLLTIDITNSNSNYTYPQDNGNDSDKTTINNDSNNNNNSGDQLSAYDLQNSSFIFIIFMISQLISIIYFAKRNRLLLNLDYLKSSYQNLNNVASSLASLPIYLKENQLILLPKWLGIGSIKKVSIKESLKFIVFQFLLFIIIIMYQYQSNFWFFNFDNINVDSNPLPSSSKGSHSSNSHTSIIKTMDELKASYNNLTIDFSKLLAYTIVAPIFEELFFRGLITFKMSRRCNSYLYCIISSNCLFALFHLINLIETDFTKSYIFLQVFLGFIFGVNLSLSFYRDQTIWSSVLLHSFNNILSLFMPTKISAEIYHIILIIVLYQSILLCILFKTQYSKLKSRSIDQKNK